MRARLEGMVFDAADALIGRPGRFRPSPPVRFPKKLAGSVGLAWLAFTHQDFHETEPELIHPLADVLNFSAASLFADLFEFSGGGPGRNVERPPGAGGSPLLLAGIQELDLEGETRPIPAHHRIAPCSSGWPGR